MMVDKLDLDLSLSLLPSSDQERDSLQVREGIVAPSRLILRAIDVNQKPPTEKAADLEEEDEGVSSSPVSTLSSVSGKRCERDPFSGEVHHHNQLERTSSRGISEDEDGETSRKKLRLSKEQSAILEECFKEHSTLNTKQKLALAKQLNLRPRQVEVWFQNRRARTKSRQTEVDCEYLKRWCDKLSEENRRLQKEIAELRALKSLHPCNFPLDLASPTTLAVCPSYQRSVMLPSNSSTATITATAPLPSSPTNHDLFTNDVRPDPKYWLRST